MKNKTPRLLAELIVASAREKGGIVILLSAWEDLGWEDLGFVGGLGRWLPDRNCNM